MFFPQLIAGPIVRASYFLPQLKKKVFDYKKYDKYIFIIFVGLFKKIVLADYLSFFADYTFNNPASGDFLTTITGIYSFCFQIYFDFSGYSDIAIGTAGLLGYKIPLNFNNPYSAGSITDFWRKWHISLLGWLKDYLYISLGGNRMKTRIGVYRNLFITMFLGGLWHGANLTFLVWGIIQGFLLIVEKYFKIKINNKNVLMKIFIFHLICISWIVFRIQKLEDFSCIINSLFRTPKEWSLNGQLILVYVIVLATYVYQNINVEINLKRYFLRLNIIYKSFVYALVIMSIILFTETTAKPFIYFQF
jgi:D-alanyl-lipoteichoic acid acyltransferase DltB (MBOAT superfamily)